MARQHNHYFKKVEGLADIDVYRVLKLWNVTDPCIQHALKKLMVAGGRGAGKSIDKDIQEAIDSLVRWQEMQREDALAAVPAGVTPATEFGERAGASSALAEANAQTTWPRIT